MSRSPFRTRELTEFLIPALLGITGFLATSGAILSPSNIVWLRQGDLAVSYLGWAFYRQAPWSIPLGANPSYGLEFHSSIYYSDSIPLLAIGFKMASQWLPEPFQYLGLWALLCFVLQGVFGWKLVGLVSESRWIKAIAVVFFILAPPMLNRIYAHLALVGHWIILAALYMYLRPARKGRAWRWALIVAGAIGIHAYLFAMAAVLWAADLLRRYVECRRDGGRDSLTPLLVESLTIPILALVVAWQCGFFMVPPRGMGATGFGYYKMNVLAPVDSRGWSAFLPALGGRRGEREGFNYLGLGGLLLIAAAAWALPMQRQAMALGLRTRILALVALVLTLTAITHHIGVGGRQFSIPFPPRLESVLQISPVQSTGRLFWVPYYLLLWSSVLVLGKALHARWLVPLVAVAAVLQLVDLRPGLTDLRRHNAAMASRPLADALTGPFWAQAGERYAKVRQWPAQISTDGWERVAFYAQQHGMGTDMVKLARVDWNSFSAAQARQRALLLAGQPDPEALYLVGDDHVEFVRANLTDSEDALFRLDGFNVLAPSWGSRLPEGAVDLRRTADQV